MVEWCGTYPQTHGVMRQKVIIRNWRAYVAEEMSNWIDPGKKEMESDNDFHCFDNHFPNAIDQTSQKQNQFVVCKSEAITKRSIGMLTKDTHSRSKKFWSNTTTLDLEFMHILNSKP